MKSRKLEALKIRRDAAKLASLRKHPQHVNNEEENRYSSDRLTYLGNFTKGLPHDSSTGIITDPADYQKFVRGIDSGDVRDFADTPLGPPGMDRVEFPQWQSQIAKEAKATVRAWESQGAGLTFDLQGLDAQAVTMPPAPTLDSPELVTEMLELYLMALLRDVPFAKFKDTLAINKAIKKLNDTTWIANPESLDFSPEEKARIRQPFTNQTVFRGVAPGDDVGCYISQFLLVGNRGIKNIEELSNGFIQYGANRIDQRVRFAEPDKDYMTTWEAWLDVQNGARVNGLETYIDDPGYRFIATPRDLATYVHYDALYQPYLDACLILLGMGSKFDPGIPFQAPDFIDKQQGFAQFGAPHILTLVAEVATRALKAVRFQKFNVHRRLRPEAVGGWITRYCNGKTENLEIIAPLVDGLGKVLEEIAAYNQRQNQQFPDRQSDRNNDFTDSFLLPMAFPEGSPMHPSYGAGHATVAGACVTILKAFFDTSATLPFFDTSNIPFCYQASPDGSRLEKVELPQPLTVEGELNKLAANISIGRNWAGVHYYTDYIESLRLGEKIAIAILEEQKLTYRENFSMTIPLFDGGSIRI